MRIKFVCLITLLTLTACSGEAVIQEPTEAPTLTVAPSIEPPPPEMQPSDLEGVTWRLVSFIDRKGNQKSVLPDTNVTVEFESEQVRGNAGCNQYFASYQVDGERLSFSSAGMTEMFCTAPDGIMEQEVEYLSTLGRVVTYSVVDGRLQMFDDLGQTVLTYTP